MKLHPICFCMAPVILLCGCTDAKRASFNSLGSPGHIICYSGGKVIYEGDSTGRIATVEPSDGWELKDRKTGKFVRVSGDCVLEN